MTPFRASGSLAVAVLLASFVVAPSAGAETDPNSQRLIGVRHSLLGTHHAYQQTYRGLDVLGGRLDRHRYDDGDARVFDSRKQVAGDVDTSPTVSRDEALRSAGPHARDAELVVQPGSAAKLVWAVYATPATGTTRTLVDAHSGNVLGTNEMVWHVEGTGRVFDPNPVVTLRDPSLRDNNDADVAALAPAYRTVALRHLDGSGFLRGDYAVISLPVELLAYSASNVFDYPRSSPRFSQVMAYYHVTTAQEYIQSLGFAQVQSSPQALHPDALPFDNSFFDPVTDSISFGTGGVDDAEDADVIWHEYAHAIQHDQIPDYGQSRDARAIGEGFADYWATTMSQPVNDGYDLPCFGDWDATVLLTEPRCWTRTDTDLTIADRTGQEHHDGQIWSRALWDVNQALGRDITNTIVLESQFVFAPDTTFDEAALATVDTARRLFGAQIARVVHGAFRDRGMLMKVRPERRTGPPVSPVASPGMHEIARLDSEIPGQDLHTLDFEPYGLNDRQQALFASELPTSGEGLYLRDLRGTQALARTGEAAPGGGTFGLGVLPGPTLNDRGDVAFAYAPPRLLRPFSRGSSLYRARSGVVSPLVVPGETRSPTGGVFVGVGNRPAVEASGAVVFAGMIETTSGITRPLGMGIFRADAAGSSIERLAAPGDDVALLGRLDFADQPSVNDSGDVAFTGHLAGTVCGSTVPQTILIGCLRELFVSDSSTRVIERLVARGDAAPGGGIFNRVAFPVINNGGDVLFQAVVQTAGGLERGLFLARDRSVVAIARIGQHQPGGGAIAVLAGQPGNWDINDRGDVSYSATLDTNDNDDEFVDQGLYRWSGGDTQLVVRSGTSVPGGELLALQSPIVWGTAIPFSGALINNSRQVLFAATVSQPHNDAVILYVAG